MSTPLVSVCLPNLNTLPFLQERVDTIFNQSYQNWELIVSDSFSDDGAWEFFERLAKEDRRVSIAQAPRGLYANWNNCVHRSKGEYVYIATSDDTMALDCIEKLVSALERYKDCDLAHCRLRRIDAEGRPTEDLWSRHSLFARSSGDLISQTHIRRAPFDGLLHILGSIVYLSITQLLIRRSLFERIGLFDTRWGSVGDFNWGMRASLVSNTVHVANTWGGFRIHSGQATSKFDFESPRHFVIVDEMIEDALRRSRDSLAPQLRKLEEADWWKDAWEMRRFFAEMALRNDSFRRRVFLVRRMLCGSKAAWSHVFKRLFDQPGYRCLDTSRVEAWLSSVGIAPILYPAES